MACWSNGMTSHGTLSTAGRSGVSLSHHPARQPAAAGLLLRGGLPSLSAPAARAKSPLAAAGVGVLSDAQSCPLDRGT